ncbi:MAG: GrpB family protein [Candidatus Omnitrophica bacterium]|nr:GrpB family protein [Candidatus Omnitrophota bacterium]
MLGLKRGTVKLCEHHDEWAELYEQEKQLLKNIFGDKIIEMEHIGSTAIPGVPAKPIIDINTAIKSLDKETVDEFIEPLQKVGYTYMHEYPNRKFFVKGPEEKRTHHLNLVEVGNQTDWHDKILFRDYLNSHQEARDEYGKLKLDLASKFADDRESYTKAKENFILEIIKKARLTMPKGVAGILENYDGTYLLHLRDSDAPTMAGEWCLVGGAVENNESPEDAIAREVKEETNLDLQEPVFVKDFIYNGKMISIFHCKINTRNQKMILGEGKQLKFFSLDELSRLLSNLGSCNPYLQVLSDFAFVKTNRVEVNQKQCELIADRLRPLRFRREHFNRPFLTFKSGAETKLRAFLFASAICHQTHSLIYRKKNLKGWSCLEDTYTILGEVNSPLLDPEYISKLSVNELSELLKPVFAEDGSPENCTLDRLDERSAFLINISQQLKENYDGKVSNLLAESNGYLINNGSGLYELLEELDGFTDPLKKKSTVFVQLVKNTNLIQIKDPESIEPVMDYHMQRLMLRTGCIEVKDEELKRALYERQNLESDSDVRLASVEAVRLMGRLAQKDFFEMDELLWSLSRSCCHEQPLCTAGHCNKTPCTFFTFIDLPEHERCIFDGICSGQNDESFRKYWQPVVETNYY